MGQAKRRGTFEERQAAAISRNTAILKKLEDHDIKPKPQRRITNNDYLLAAAILAALPPRR